MIKILAIDDDLDFHEILKVKLAGVEYSLTLTQNEASFFEKFSSENFDIFLLDLAIDGHPLKGLELITKIRHEKSSELPIIILTNSSSKRNISSALELGANDFISKPVIGKLLIAKINALVHGNQAFAKELEFGTTPGKLPGIHLSTKLHLVSVTEMGFLVEGNAYVAKGTKLKLKSARINEIFDTTTIEVSCTGFDSETSGIYQNNFEIDPDQKELISKLKLWLKANQK